MKKYKTFEAINVEDISGFSGLENEVLTFFDFSEKTDPLIIECFGITFPDANYAINRNKSRYFVLEYIVSGKGYLEINGNNHIVEQGMAYLLEPGSSHRYGANKNDPYKKYWVNFYGDIFIQILEAYGLSGINTFNNVDLSKDFVKLFNLEKKSIYNNQIYKEAGSIIFNMLMKLVDASEKKPKESSLAADIIRKLDESITSNISIEQICSELYISKSKLMREFKKYYHTTPHEYLLDRKMSLAKTILANKYQSIKSIAERLDFADEHYFTNVFKKRVGMTPTQFRNEKIKS